jgi:hypothetical protein
MPSLFVVLRGLVAERRHLGFHAEVFLSASIFVVQDDRSTVIREIASVNDGVACSLDFLPISTLSCICQSLKSFEHWAYYELATYLISGRSRGPIRHAQADVSLSLMDNFIAADNYSNRCQRSI